MIIVLQSRKTTATIFTIIFILLVLHLFMCLTFIISFVCFRNEATCLQQPVSTAHSKQLTREKESDKKSQQNVSIAKPRHCSQHLENDKPVVKQDYQSVTQSKECFDNKQKDDEHQSIIAAAGIEKSSASVSEMLYGASNRKETHESVADVSQTEFASGMASDMSDLLERRRFVTREGEPPRVGTDSDQSASSAMSEGSRKRRKDKSSMRKSKLNESSDGKFCLCATSCFVHRSVCQHFGCSHRGTFVT